MLSPYLNYYHHPCLFATEARGAKGNVRRRYRRRDVATPYEKLKSLPDAERFLKPGLTFAELDETAYAMSDLEANRRANQARDELFWTIGRPFAPALERAVAVASTHAGASPWTPALAGAQGSAVWNAYPGHRAETGVVSLAGRGDRRSLP